MNCILPDWPAPPRIRAAVTLRQEGVSKGRYASFNLANHVGDAPVCVERNRSILKEYLGRNLQPVWLQQVHGITVVDAGSCETGFAADASVVFDDKAICAVLTADCLPVMFCDQSGSRAGVAHAGWRGLAAGVLEATVQALNCPPAELMAWLGPAIGPNSFEVGEDVRSSFIRYSAECIGAFRSNGAGDHWLADLYQLARLRLQAMGVEHIYGGGFCTFTDQQRFYSYRRDKDTGRMASLIWLAD